MKDLNLSIEAGQAAKVHLSDQAATVRVDDMDGDGSGRGADPMAPGTPEPTITGAPFWLINVTAITSEGSPITCQLWRASVSDVITSVRRSDADKDAAPVIRVFTHIVRGIETVTSGPERGATRPTDCTIEWDWNSHTLCNPSILHGSRGWPIQMVALAIGDVSPIPSRTERKGRRGR